MSEPNGWGLLNRMFGFGRGGTEADRTAGSGAGHPRASERSSATFAADTPGRRVVHAIFQRLQIDDEWSVWDANGFTWWGHRFAQRVWTDDGRESHGVRVYRVSAETEFVETGGTEPDLTFLKVWLTGAILTGLVHDPRSGTIRSRLAAVVHQETVAWVSELLSHATLLQVAEIEMMGEALAGALGLTPARSAHPTAGARATLDDIFAAVNDAIVPAGQLPSFWARNPREFTGAVALLNGAPHFRARQGVAMAGEAGLSAEIGVGTNPGPAIRGGQSALIQVEADERHPWLGSGARFTLTMPFRPPATNPALACMTLNRIEHDQGGDARGLGSWCVSPVNGMLSHVAFLPNLLYKPGLVVQLAMSVGLRAIWADGLFQRPPRELAGFRWG